MSQDSVAASLFAALVACDPDKPDKLMMGDPAGKFVWKDRWTQELQFYKDGYASGVVDLLRHLDNAGKTNSVLAGDILAATSCAVRQKLNAVGKLMNFINPQLAKITDPLESTSGAIFDILHV
jgi:hypothetical protein